MHLSILIPCYNWDVFDFINQLHNLCVKEKKIINFEIICYEDASRHTYSNNLIENLKNVKYLNFKGNKFIFLGLRQRRAAFLCICDQKDNIFITRKYALCRYFPAKDRLKIPR